MIFFGSRGGPARMVLAIVAVGVLGLLTFVVFNLNNRLDNQQRANVTSIAASQGIVDVNDKVTGQLRQLTELTHTAQTALDATAALGPLLIKLDEAIAPAAAMLASKHRGCPDDQRPAHQHPVHSRRGPEHRAPVGVLGRRVRRAGKPAAGDRAGAGKRPEGLCRIGKNDQPDASTSWLSTLSPSTNRHHYYSNWT
uniref:Orf9 protein n=1 Tax=Rhodococcus sp. CIR2 TaxID=90325 RepID=Q9WXG4_9NOCA|nr:orf9 [Rhodococcus sp. CIR2]